MIAGGSDFLVTTSGSVSSLAADELFKVAEGLEMCGRVAAGLAGCVGSGVFTGPAAPAGDDDGEA